MEHRLIFAGFGGQGVLSMGMLIAYSGMMEDKQVSWLPSYGPEMRGGTANCSVIVSDEPVGAPVVSEPTCAIVMNKPSLAKFEKTVTPGGKLFINSSLIDDKCSRSDVEAIYVPVGDIAIEIGNLKTANMVMLGAFLKLNPVVSTDSVLKSFLKVLGASKEKLIPINQKALEAGANAIS